MESFGCEENRGCLRVPNRLFLEANENDLGRGIHASAILLGTFRDCCDGVPVRRARGPERNGYLDYGRPIQFRYRRYQHHEPRHRCPVQRDQPGSAIEHRDLQLQDQRRSRHYSVQQPYPTDAVGHACFVIYGDDTGQCRTRRGRRLRRAHHLRLLCQSADHGLHQRQQRFLGPAIHNVRRPRRGPERTNDQRN